MSIRKRRKYTESRTSPTDTRRGCLCADGKTYSSKCCDGSLQGQGIGSLLNQSISDITIEDTTNTVVNVSGDSTTTTTTSTTTTTTTLPPTTTTTTSTTTTTTSTTTTTTTAPPVGASALQTGELLLGTMNSDIGFSSPCYYQIFADSGPTSTEASRYNLPSTAFAMIQSGGGAGINSTAAAYFVTLLTGVDSPSINTNYSLGIYLCYTNNGGSSCASTSILDTTGINVRYVLNSQGGHTIIIDDPSNNITGASPINAVINIFGTYDVVAL